MDAGMVIAVMLGRVFKIEMALRELVLVAGKTRRGRIAAEFSNRGATPPAAKNSPARRVVGLQSVLAVSEKISIPSFQSLQQSSFHFEDTPQPLPTHFQRFTPLIFSVVRSRFSA
jgi:hypothetical protein